MSRWFKDGHGIASLAIDDRGVQYADGLFETVAIRDGELRLWRLHVDRLHTGCRRLGIAEPDPNRLHARGMQAIAAGGDEAADGILKIIVTRGVGPRGYAPPAAPTPSILYGVFDRSRHPDEYYRAGVAVRICSSRLSMQPQTAGIKVLSRLDQVLARSEWQDADTAEGLMLDQHGSLVCGTMSNLFIVADRQIWTPEIVECGVSGVMRQHILALLEGTDIPCNVTTITPDMFDDAQEVFLCNSQIGIWPVAQCGQKTVADWPVTRRIVQLLRQSGVHEGP